MAKRLPDPPEDIEQSLTAALERMEGTARSALVPVAALYRLPDYSMLAVTGGEWEHFAGRFPLDSITFEPNTKAWRIAATAQSNPWRG